jgi:L-ascorbate metabolism protein UlaG (beta-lactamase superfamily)
MTVRHDNLDVEWLGYATVRIESEDTVLYLDPGRYGVMTGEWEPDTEGVAHPPSQDYAPGDADLICVTHVHHYDPEAIDRVANEHTTVVIHEAVSASDTGRDVTAVRDLPYDVRRVSHETQFVAAGVPVWTVAAYNDPDGKRTSAGGTPFHPEGMGCGYLLSVDDTRVFWPGDTDVLEGHAELDVSLFVPPIGGSFTMDRTGAAALAAEMDPELVVPIHYNTFDALETDSSVFAADVAAAGVPVALDERA